MDNYRAWFKAETDTFKENYCTQVDNYFDLVLSQLDVIACRSGSEATMKLSLIRIGNLATLYQQQLTWLSGRYFDNKPTFDSISSAINDSTSGSNLNTTSHANTRDSYQVNAFAECSTNQQQLDNIRKGSDAIVGMPKYSDGGFPRLDSTLSDHQFVSLSPSNHNIASQSTLLSPLVSSKAPSEQSPKSVSVGQSYDQNDTDTTLSEVHQWESELDPNCDCKDCQPDKMQIQAENNSSVVALESDNSDGSVATSPKGSNGHRPRVIKSELDFERQFELNLAQLTSDMESDKVDSSSGGQVNEMKEAKLIEVKGHAQETPEQASLGAFKRTLASPLPTGSTDGKRTRGVQVKKGHTGTLTRHLRGHRNDKYYRCTWPECTHKSTYRSVVITHIRMIHFKLPQSKKQQTEENIKDDRDPRVYLAED